MLLVSIMFRYPGLVSTSDIRVKYERSVLRASIPVSYPGPALLSFIPTSHPVLHYQLNPNPESNYKAMDLVFQYRIPFQWNNPYLYHASRIPYPASSLLIVSRLRLLNWKCYAGLINMASKLVALIHSESTSRNIRWIEAPLFPQHANKPMIIACLGIAETWSPFQRK